VQERDPLAPLGGELGGAKGVGHLEGGVLVDVPLALAGKDQLNTSALVRRLLRQAVQDPGGQVLTVEQVEAIARRVVAESANA